MSIESSRDSFERSRFTRRTATVTISAPLASIARAVSWPDLYLPVPTIKRERNERPAITNESIDSIVASSPESKQRLGVIPPTQFRYLERKTERRVTEMHRKKMHAKVWRQG